MEIFEENDEILIVQIMDMENEHLKKKYRIQSRGGKGIKTCNITDKTGEVVAVKTIQPELKKI